MITTTSRRLLIIVAALVLSLAVAGTSTAAPLLVTPTPTPTPGPNNQPISSFYVPPQQPPWALPVMPFWGTGTPIATLYAATPQHATDFPAQMGTATAQIGSFTDPVSSVATPIAGIVQAGPTQTGDDINTGLDPVGEGEVTFSSIGDQIESGVETAVGTAKVFLQDIGDMVTYSPWLAPVPLLVVTPVIIGMFASMIFLLIKGVTWLVNFLIKVFTFVGVWKPG